MTTKLPTTNYYKITKPGTGIVLEAMYEFFHGDPVDARRAYAALLRTASRKSWPTDKLSVFRAVAGVPANVPEIGFMHPDADPFAIAGGE